MLDLFPGDRPLVPGLAYHPEVVGREEEAALIPALEATPLHPVIMHGYPAKRTVAHSGWDYGYDRRSIAPASPIPEFLRGLQERAGSLSGLPPEIFEEVLLTRYPEGSGIGWHRDAPVFGEPVVGFSLGTACALRFRVKEHGRWVRRNVDLAPRSAYLLAGPARGVWQHSIEATPGIRWSITFRRLKAPAGEALQERR